jgi:hypothetical protein
LLLPLLLWLRLLLLATAATTAAVAAAPAGVAAATIAWRTGAAHTPATIAALPCTLHLLATGQAGEDR